VAARHLNAAIELAPREELPALHERLGQIWNGGEQAAEAFERAYDLARELGVGTSEELRLLGQAMTVRARWTGSIGRQLTPDERDHRFDEVERLLEATSDEQARVHGLLAMAFRPMSTNDRATTAELATSSAWAERALALARKLDQPDLMSAALDASSVATLGDDRMTEVLDLVKQRYAIASRVSAGERTDSMIVEAWAESIRGNLVAAERAADQARAGLGEGQASAWVLGATAWRILALHALGRWDEAVVEGGRAEREWQESELQAPGFSLNGFIGLFGIARARGDVLAAAHWRELIGRIHTRTDPSIRNQRLVGYLNDDFPGLVALAVDFRSFTPRLDYIYFVLSHLADHRQAVPLPALEELIAYMTERDLALVATQAIRLRGLMREDERDLEAALAAFEGMDSRPFIARVHAELGLLRDDPALVELGLQELDALGDIDQAARIAAIRRSGVPTGR
jgi:hypothetical protein